MQLIKRSKHITILAIDRAEEPLLDACAKLSQDTDRDIDCILLVNKSYVNSVDYHGNEATSRFKEIVCDFDNTENLSKIIRDNTKGDLVIHCRMETAIQDLCKVIPVLPKKTLVTSIESLIVTTQKIMMRTKMAKDYPEICPKFINIQTAKDFSINKILDFEYPIIVKPNGLNSSLLVSKCDTQDELIECIDNTFKIIDKVYADEHGTGSPSVVIEEFMQGKMYSIDAYIDHRNKISYLPPIRVITASEIGKHGFYGYLRRTPDNDLSEEDIINANLCVEKAILSTGLRSSTAHIELYKTDSGWKIIEIGPRIGGYRQEMYKFAYGIDHFYNDLRIHFGLAPVVEKQIEKHVAAFNIFAEDEGVISKINGIEEIKNLNSTKKIGVYAKIGGWAKKSTNGGNKLIDILLVNENLEQFESDIIKVRKLVEVLTKPS